MLKLNWNLKLDRLVPVCLALGLLTTGTTGCGSGSSKNPAIPGVKYSATFADGYFLMSVALQGVPLEAGGRVALDARRLPNSYAEVGPDFQSGGTLVVIGLAAQDVLNASGSSLFEASSLPGGRPLPGVAAGTLPGVAVNLGSRLSNLAVYFGNGAFGLFMPVKLACKDTVASFRFYAQGTRVGNLSLVCSDSAGLNSGFLALVSKQIPAVAAALATVQ